MSSYNLVGSPSIVTPQSTVRGIRALNEDLIDNSPIIDGSGNLSMLGDISVNKITYNSLEPPIPSGAPSNSGLWRYESTNSPPITGEILLNNSGAYNSTELLVNIIDSNSIDLSTWLASINISDILSLQNNLNVKDFANYSVVNITPDSNYYTFDIKLINNGSNPVVKDGDNYYLALSTSGTQGATGAQGDQGIKGDTGAQGVAGVIGDQGAQGATGAQGTKGDRGDTGAQGETGAQGSQGLTGPEGAQGASGAVGAVGAQGVKGDQGAKGDDG